MIDGFADFHLLRPIWLLLLVPALALWWLERREADTTARWRKVIDPVLLRHLTVGGDTGRKLRPEDVLLLGWLLGILAIAGPTWRQVPSPLAQSARPAMFVVKVTDSMMEQDLAPTRLDRAREKMADLLNLREGAPTGLIAYAGSAHLVLPPTSDAGVVRTMADALAPQLMPRQGDALIDAVKLAAATLADGGQGGSVVVFADSGPSDATPTNFDAPIKLFAMLPPQRASADPSLRAAASAIDANLLVPTLDTADVEHLARVLATAGPPPLLPGEAARWQEAGWWLTPFVALLALAWFRRGWVLA